MQAVLSPQRSHLAPEYSESCVKLTVAKHLGLPDIEHLTKSKQGQGSHYLIQIYYFKFYEVIYFLFLN